MATPILLFGIGAGDDLLAYDPDAADDTGTAIALRAQSQNIAFSGAAQETSVFSLVVVVTHTMAATIRVTPVWDGVPQDGTGGTTDLRHTITLTSKAARTTERVALNMEVPVVDLAGTELARVAQRATFYGVRLDTPALAIGELIVDSVYVEFEPAEDTLTAQNTT